MAIPKEPTAPNPATAPQHFVNPTQRDLRARAVYRLQIGLFGLAAMLLLVGLANIVMDRAKESERLAGAHPAAVEKSKQGSDPLAEIGVVPAADPSADSNATSGN